MSESREWIVLRWAHFDPIWRRCWDRPFTCDGQRYVSYRDIETEWYDQALATAADGTSAFLAEACWTTRHYLERRPEMLPVLRRLAREGRFEQLAAGENVVDTNLIHGELLARNFILGLLWAEETFGVRPSTGWQCDGFGSSAQLPQVLRGCGVAWLPLLGYNLPTAPYWRGLDGSLVLWQAPEVFSEYPWGGGTENMNTFRKHAACAACRGSGCTACGGKGVDYERIGRGELRWSGAGANPRSRTVGVWIWGEEILPGTQVEADIARLRAAHPGVEIRQGTYRDAARRLAAHLAAVDHPPAEQISTKVEHNPAQSGCYTTRIGIKQGHREAEHLLLAAETLDTVLAGAGQHDRLRDLWKRMTLSGFHDAITSSHNDPAYDELRDLQAAVQQDARVILGAAAARATDGVEGHLTVFNPRGHAASPVVTAPLPAGWAGAEVHAGTDRLPVYRAREGQVEFLARDLPALGARAFSLREAPATAAADITASGKAACGPFCLRWDDRGICALTVDGVGEVLDRGKYLLAEPVLEVDEGDPWSTRNIAKPRTRLAPYTRLESVRREGDAVIVATRTRHPNCDDTLTLAPGADSRVTYLEVCQQFIAREGCACLEVVTDVDWYAGSRKLRLAFPAFADTNQGLYEIPFGALERGRHEQAASTMTAGCGDWPAIHWAAIRGPACTLAVANRGTPAHRVEDGTLFVSILRSPDSPSALLEPGSAYPAINFQGMHDYGHHRFHHALFAGAPDLPVSALARQAETFNAAFPVVPGALLPGLPAWTLEARDALLVTVKRAERSRGVVVRLIVMGAQPDTITLTPPAGVFSRAWRTNLLEEAEAELAWLDGRVVLAADGWKVVTLRFEAAGP